MYPRRGDRVVNTRGGLIGYVKYGVDLHGPRFIVWIGQSFYRLLEWDRSWGAWIAFGRGKKSEAIDL